MASAHITLKWDYGAEPLQVSHSQPTRRGAVALPISAELHSEVQAWSADLEALMWGDRGPDRRRGEPDRGELIRLNEVGRSLAQQVRQALDESWRVTYFDEVLHRDVLVEVAKAGPSRRHHGT